MRLPPRPPSGAQLALLKKNACPVTACPYYLNHLMHRQYHPFDTFRTALTSHTCFGLQLFAPSCQYKSKARVCVEIGVLLLKMLRMVFVIVMLRHSHAFCMLIDL